MLHITKGIVETSSSGDAGNPGSFTDSSWVGHVSEPGSAGFRFDGPVTSALLAAHPVNSNVTGIHCGRSCDLCHCGRKHRSRRHLLDVALNDTLPTGFDGSSLNLSITDGIGTVVLPRTGISGNNIATDLFTAQGIRITDDGDGILDPTRNDWRQCASDNV